VPKHARPHPQSVPKHARPRVAKYSALFFSTWTMKSLLKKNEHASLCIPARIKKKKTIN